MVLPISYIDIHAHVSLRAFNMFKPGVKRSMWHKTSNPIPSSAITRWANIKTNEISKESQSNLYAYSEGNARVVVDSLYPIEREWFNFRKFPGFLMRKKMMEEILSITTGINKNRLRKLLEEDNYFNELKENYKWLLHHEGNSPCREYRYHVVGSHHEMIKVLNSSPKNIAIIPAIEGAHAFGLKHSALIKLDHTSQKEMMIANIREAKNWLHPPFYVTLAHHFWNNLCGHCNSFKPPVNLIFNQAIGKNKGISELGWDVIMELLNKKTGRRVLIDVKHMSIKARMEYYEFVEKYNRINPDTIPVISSHSAVSGYENFKESLLFGDQNGRQNLPFNNWSMNLCEEEIEIIANSGGIIGILMDKAVIGAPSIVKGILTLHGDSQKNGFVKLIWDNIFFIVKSVAKASAWNIPVLGTDYDGLINYIDPYENASKIDQLAKDLRYYLEDTSYRQELWFGLTPKEIVNKIMNRNALNFLEKHYCD